LRVRVGAYVRIIVWVAGVRVQVRVQVRVTGKG
jgi:hypothetical protein